MGLFGIKLPNPIKVVSDAARNVINAPAKVVETAKNVADNAGRAIRHGVDEFVDNTRDAVRIAAPILDKATDIVGDGLTAAGKGLEKLGGPVPFNPLSTLGQAAQVTGALVRDPVKNAQNVANTVGDLARDGWNLVTNSPHVLNVNKQVETLEPGESISTSLGVEGDGAGIAAKINGEMSVRRLDADSVAANGGKGEYVVRVGGEVGVGVMAKAGAKFAEAGAEAFATAGGQVEFRFDTKEEAMAATKTIAEFAAVSALSTMPMGFAASYAANHALGNPAADLAKLKDNLTAVEVKVGVEGQAKASAGLSGSRMLGAKGGDGVDDAAAAAGKSGLGQKIKDNALGQLKAEVGAKVSADVEMTARLEFKNGQPTGIALREELELSGSAAANAAAGLFAVKVGGQANAYAQGKVRVEQRFDLPADFSFGELVRSPGATIDEVAKTAGETATTSIRFDGVATAGANLKIPGSRQESDGYRARIELEGKTADILRSGALDEVFSGDFAAALEALDDATVASGFVDPVRVTQQDLGIGLHLGVAGGEIKAESLRVDVTGQHQKLTEEQLEAALMNGLDRLPFRG